MLTKMSKMTGTQMTINIKLMIYSKLYTKMIPGYEGTYENK